MADKWKKWPKGAWSHSQWETLRRCPKAHKLKHREKLYRVGFKPLALEIGTCFHDALETLGEMAIWGPTNFQDWDDAVKAARQRCKDPGAGLEATRLIAEYRRFYGYENAGYGDHEVEAVEEVLLCGDLHKDIGGMAAIADAVTLFQKDRFIWEHKTAGKKSSGTVEEICQSLKVGSQACVLAYAGREKWGTIPTIIRNVTIKTKNVAFERFALTFTDDDLDRWAEDQRELEEMVGLSCANRDACAPTMGYRCGYFEYCHGTDEERELLYRQKKGG